MSSARTRALAPAKLTLSLRVMGTRPDGFHDLEALTVMISSPCDTVRLDAAPAGVVELTVVGGGLDVPDDDTNLVVRAARAVLPEHVGAAIELTKVVPTGAGLGGGSADAAAVLRMLRARYGLDAGVVGAAAIELGSDVPVCLMGEPVMMRGRGEILEPVELAGDLHVVVASPGFGLSTPAVFRAWDEMGGPRGSRTVAPPRAVAHLARELGNDLEDAAERVDPQVRAFREAIESVAGLPACLAGSGSAFWFSVEDAIAAADVAARLSAELEIETFAGYALRKPVA